MHVSPLLLILWLGKLVAIHRKVHLFDIDIPGQIRFKVRALLSDQQPTFNCVGERNADRWLFYDIF